MYEDEYENLNEEFKIVGSENRQQSHFYTSTEMFKNTTLTKDELSHDDMTGDPSRGKSIKNSRPAVYDIHSASSSVSSQSIQNKKEPRKVNVKVCPICSGPQISVCSCSKQDSYCAKSHKWHLDNGKIILGHSH